MSSILAQSVTPTAITIALKSGISVVLTAASIPSADNTPALASTWATTTLQASLVSAGSTVYVAVNVFSLGPPVDWTIVTSDIPITVDNWF